MFLKITENSAILAAVNMIVTTIIMFFFMNDITAISKGEHQSTIFFLSTTLIAASYGFLWLIFLSVVFPLKFLKSEKLKRWLFLLLETGFWFIISVLFIFHYLDVQTFVTTGMHLYSPFVIDNLMMKNIFNEINFGINTLATFFLFFALVFILNGLILFFAKRFLKHDKTLIFPIVFISLVIISFFVSFAVKTEDIIKDEGSETIPFFDEIYSEFGDFNSDELKTLKILYPHKIFANEKIEKKPDILFILVESLRQDVFNEEIMPYTHNFSKKCITSQHHHSGELSTIYGTFSYLYGLNIHHYYPFFFSKSRSVPIQILKNNGYRTIGAAASNLKNMSIHSEVLTDQFDEYKEFNGKEWEKDENMIKWIKDKVDKNDTATPYFYFMFFASTHHNYYFPPEYGKHKPFIEVDFNYFKGTTLKNRKEEVFNRYLNAAEYTDSKIHEVLEYFKDKIERKELIVVMTGDHGEEFWDHGTLGHGKISNNIRSRVPMMICLPEMEPKEVFLSSHVDIFPTVIDFLKAGNDINYLNWSNGHSLLKELPPDRYITVGGFDFPKRSTEVTLINEKGKLFLQKTTDSINAHNHFNISKRTDLEDNKLNATESEKDLDWMILKFAEDMNKFFK